jgi:hypothetical protein
VAPPVVDLTDLQRVVGQYADQHQLIVAAGPLTAATLLRTITKSKLVSGAVAVGGAWLTVQMISGSTLKLIHEQFGYLQSLIGN